MSYTREQLFAAIRAADQAGDGEAVKALAARLQEMDAGGADVVQQALERGDSFEQIVQVARENGLEVDPKALRANIVARESGGRTAVVERPQPEAYTTSNLLADQARNVAPGLLQGFVGALEFPLDVSRAAGAGIQSALGAAGGGILDFAGFNNAADTVRSASYGAAQSQLDDVASGAREIERLAPTVPGREGERLTANILGGTLLPIGPRSAPRPQAPSAAATANSTAREVVREGQKRGVRVMTSDVKPPENFVSRTMRATGERIPYAGTGGPRAAQQEERVGAVKNFLEEYGVTGVGDFLGDVAKDFTTRRGRQVVVLSGRKNQVIEGISEPYTTSPRAVQAIASEIRRLRGIDAQEYAPVIDRLQRFGDALTSGKSLSQIEGQRRLLGELFADPNLARIKSEGQRAINSIYRPLREDMGAFIRQNGGDEAYRRWDNANSQLSTLAGDLSNSAFRSVLQNAGSTPEDVGRLLFSTKPSDVQRLFGSLSASGKAKARSALVFEALKRSGGIRDGRIADDLSPQRFANTVNRMAGQMGVAFSETDLASVQGLSRLLNATQRASVASASPPTGVQNALPIGAMALVDMLGSMGAAVTGSAGIGGIARIYESAPVRNMLISLSKTPEGSKQEAALTRRIYNAMAAQPGLISDDIARAVNDNPAGRLAAEEQQPSEPQ